LFLPHNAPDNFAEFFKDIAWIQIEKLSDEHDLSDFSCGTSKDDIELALFLTEDALKQQKEKANVTHVTVLKDTKKVVAYVTTLNDKLRVSNKEKKEMSIPLEYSDFPAIKIGRLAVDKNYTNKKLGTILLFFVRGLAIENAEKVGCRFLIVDSYQRSVEFYVKQGFTRNLIQDQRRTKIIKENKDGEPQISKDYNRETISLRYDLLNPQNEK